MAYRASFLSVVSLSLLAGGLAACGFGDNQSNQPSEVDAAPADAMPIDAMPIDAPPMAKVFEVMPNLAIPDNNPIGVAVPFTVTGVVATTGLVVEVDVTHTYSGDVVIQFRRGDTTPPTIVKTLRNRIGSDTDDIKDTYMITPAELGMPLNDSYSLYFTDRSPADTGTITRVKLTFKVN
jgi:subtilisin-like proprotein convertase family protein